MFRDPFSFKGRIARTEYVLSMILSHTVLIILILFSDDFLHGSFVGTFSLVAYFWFNLAQGSKRCHDINQLGLMQIVPFYGIVLIFQEGTSGNNNYGPDPKSNIYDDSKKIKKIDWKSLLELIQKTLPFSLISSLLIALCVKFLKFNNVVFNCSIYVIIIVVYFLFLAITKEKHDLFWSRLTFSILTFTVVRIYTLFYLHYSFDILILFFELSIIFVCISLTYIPSYIYKSIIRK